MLCRLPESSTGVSQTSTQQTNKQNKTNISSQDSRVMIQGIPFPAHVSASTSFLNADIWIRQSPRVGRQEVSCEIRSSRLIPELLKESDDASQVEQPEEGGVPGRRQGPEEDEAAGERRAVGQAEEGGVEEQEGRRQGEEVRRLVANGAVSYEQNSLCQKLLCQNLLDKRSFGQSSL